MLSPKWSWAGRWGTRSVADLAVHAVNVAVWNRKPGPGAIHHSDHGAQHAAVAFSCTLKEVGILGPMGTVGDALDNVVAESFFATLDIGLLDGCSWSSRQVLALAIFKYTKGSYNRRRRHSALGCSSPLEHERRWAHTQRMREEPRQSVA